MKKKLKLKCYFITFALALSTVAVNPSATVVDADDAVEEVLGDSYYVNDDTTHEDIYENLGGEIPGEIEALDKTMDDEETDSNTFTDEGQLVDASSSDPVTNNGTSVSFDYSDASRAFEVYVSPDGKSANLLFNYQLYNYDFATGEFALEYEFPYAEYISGVSGYYSTQEFMDAYIDESNGLLYYGYNSYRNTYSDDEISNVIVYDLSSNSVKNKFSVPGVILTTVGVDKSGRIYMATDNYYKATDESSSSTEDYRLIILAPDGSTLVDMKTTYAINDFSGFCDDGTFYYIDEYMVYSAYGYPNLMGRLMNGKYAGGTVTLNETYMTYAKNIYFGDYRTPVEILNNEYLVTWNGGFYPLDEITDSSWNYDLYANKELEMGNEYDYLYNIGVNSVIIDDLAYTLYDNDTMYVYEISTGEKVKCFDSQSKIVCTKKCNDGFVILTYNGSSYSFDKIGLTEFKNVETKQYIMNDFSVYKGRTKEDIVTKFVAAAPDDNSAELYSVTGQSTAPYKENTLTDETKNNAVSVSNYYRWLAGLTGFESSDSVVWTNAGKGAVLLTASNFSHNPSQPSDMDDEFYSAALSGTSNSNIAKNSMSGQKKIIYTIRQFMNDDGYTVPGHRNTFLTRNGNKIAYGINGRALCQTVEYKDNPNPQGTATVDNNQAAYGWPAAGYFPAEDISTSAYWTVNLNTDILKLSYQPLTVTITDLDTGEVFSRTNTANGLYSSTFWGMYISFMPPKVEGSSYDGKRYKVVLDNLENPEGLPATLEYTVEFFSYSDVTYTENGIKYGSDAYGNEVICGYENTEGSVNHEVLAGLPKVNINYRTHIQTFGWEGTANDITTWKTNGAMSGTSGKAKRLEGINVVVETATDSKIDLGIQYTTHCQSYGWLPWSANGEMNGTEGEAKRLEAIKLQLTGYHADYYDVYYRVHAQSYGWLGWAKNGAPAGTAGYAKRLEGIQIVVVKKGESINQTMGNITSARAEAFVAKAGNSPIVNHPATSNTNPVIPGADTVNVAYRTHVQSYGWQAWKYNGQMSGTSGKAKRLEGINIELRNKPYEGSILYTTHVQSYGWQGDVDNPSTWKKDGEMSGTSGEAKRLEAICIMLSGDMAEKYDIYYRVHAQSFGWLGWAYNGEPAGTAGYGKRLEAIQIKLVPKGECLIFEPIGTEPTRREAYIEK